MSSCPTYDPNMLPSPRRGGRGKRSSQSPYTPRNHGPRPRYGSPRGFNSPYPPRYGGEPRQMGYGCPYGAQIGDIQQSPQYRSMRGDFTGASPNSSREENRRNCFRRTHGLFHPEMLKDPWAMLSTEGKSIYKAANFVDHRFMSYCAKLQTSPKLQDVDTGEIAPSVPMSTDHQEHLPTADITVPANARAFESQDVVNSGSNQADITQESPAAKMVERNIAPVKEEGGPQNSEVDQPKLTNEEEDCGIITF